MTKPVRSFVPPVAGWFAGVALVVAAATASADAVTYTATVSEISNTCATPAAAPITGPIVVDNTTDKVVLTFGTLPAAIGSMNSSGKLRAQAKAGDTRINYSGRVTAGGGMLIMVAEMFTGGKPTCSQSWNLTLTK